MRPPFLIDTSSFRVLSNYYESQFPSFWKLFNEAVADSTIRSVKEVYSELEQHDTNWIWKKAKSVKQIFVSPGNEETAFVAQLMSQKKYQALIGKANILQGKPVADPFLVAAGFHTGGTVVTEEKRKPNASKIPNVCDDFKIEVTNVEGMLEQLGWSF